jgi:hypothetical protein
LPSQPSNFRAALQAFAAHDVEFIVVGGVAAVLAGAPISTFDLDIVHRRQADNVARLVEALTAIDARYRDPGGRLLRPAAVALCGAGHHLLMTSCGPVDVLGQIGDGAGYDDLLPDTVQGTADGHSVRVLGLPRLIAEKERLGRDKDRAMLAILRRTLEESG